MSEATQPLSLATNEDRLERLRLFVATENARMAAVWVTLILVTYAYWGYAYGVWPQPGLLEYVLRLNGSLKNDWMMSLAPPHWALANLLGLGSNALVKQAVLALWIVGLMCLWLGVVTIARRLGATALAALASGLLLIASAVAAVGGSQALSPFMYPSGLSFALVTLGLALVLCERPGTAGVAIGLATVVHPNLGAVAAVVALAGVVVSRPWPGNAARYLAGFIALAAVPLAVLANKLDRGQISSREQYDLVVRVRNPHHQLYETFPIAEFVQTGVWLLVLCASLVVLRRDRTARRAAAVAGATVAIAGLGGLASVVGHPRTLVMAQTARVTPIIVVLAATSAAAAASRIQREAAGPLLLMGFLVASVLGSGAAMGSSGAAAVSTLGALACTTLVARVRSPRAIVRSARVAGIALVCAAAVIIVAQPRTARSLSSHDQAWRDVAAAGTKASAPGDLFLVPPDQDGFRFYSHRPIVIDFGSFPFGKGLGEWRDRMVDVTGTRQVVDPGLGSASRRNSVMAAAYDTNVRRSRLPVCRYGVKYVVARGSPDSAWLLPLYRNAEYTLYRVRPDACRRSA